ncbi:DUF5995 family protein [Autumnicola psychrophila]|uniref:DUF5995 family protein n=1 Tax=Autumnicola psychrophila TaxID=3075592 RepID=A0ABU3DVK6_9FLAO|nr:DUF5995 family protein [Zunongwangia sp. F225]MDT0687756.1 DUF5995 family protein [Zunongwangia sp. F225]
MNSIENHRKIIPEAEDPLTTIDDVLSRLDKIILEAEENEDTLGYFAVLYRRVTLEVKEGIIAGYFEDGERMEQLDVVFAKKYLEAYDNYQNGNAVSKSWQKAFDLSKDSWPITMQHLLIGMNAHINLDLGIAAAQVSGDSPIENLKVDFFRINEILAALVEEVQHNLATIWPPLKKILLKTGKYDNLVVDFSMKIARDGAWRFAQTLAGTAGEAKRQCILTRDIAVANKSSLITSDKLALSLLLWIVRIGEIGTVSDKIRKMKVSHSEKTIIKLKEV